jgi:transcriptional regulator with GAF, ATPase, and Fis domain
VREGVADTPAAEPEQDLPWFVSRMFEARELLAVTHLDDLPPEAARDRAAWERLGLRSGAAVPMVVDGAIVGVLGFGSVAREQRWSPELTSRFRLVADVIGSALARRQGEVALRAALADNERLRERLAAENVYLQGEVKEAQRFGDVVGQSPALRTTLARVEQVAATDVPVLLLGETGTGKSEAARALHAASRRAAEPFVVVDCAALAPSLVESELFGHEAGAFTGAAARRRGRLELAARGTLLLDEVGELPLELQAKLLRALEERCFERVGGTHTLHLEARVVAATNADLERAVARGRFRADLFFRLAVACVRMPPLRERRADLPELVEDALGRIAARLSVTGAPWTPGFLERLAAHDWPGNVRELHNVLELLLALGPPAELTAADLDGLLGHGSAAPCHGAAAEDRLALPGEADRLAAALGAAGGNVARAARRLGLSRSALRRRIDRHHLRPLLPRD